MLDYWFINMMIKSDGRSLSWKTFLMDLEREKEDVMNLVSFGNGVPQVQDQTPIGAWLLQGLLRLNLHETLLNLYQLKDVLDFSMLRLLNAE